MKNYITLLFSMLIIGQVFGLDKVKTVPKYVIRSDAEDSTISSGFCLIEGHVLFKGLPVADVTIYSFSYNNSSITNKDGYFSIIIDTTNAGIYTSHADFIPNYFEEYPFKSGHKIVMSFNIQKPEVYQNTIFDSPVRKPVIYAYGKSGTTFEMGISTEANITFTYPQLEDKWCITISENGLLQDKNNQQYPYLFWEGEMANLNFQKSEEKIIGSVVTKQNTVAFLEDKLTQLGFNATEKTDFITFWSPLIMKNENSFIQFLVDEEYEAISTLDISPKPNNMRRVYILFSDAKDMDDRFIDTNVHFNSFDRIGFTILEWGGTEITQPKKL